MQDFDDIDLDVLRGWSESRDPQLRAEHRLAPLARLIKLDGDQVETLHGPEVLVGRYHPQHGPVDVILRGLQDHENYRLGAPHLHMTLGEDAQWTLRSVSPGVESQVGEQVVGGPNQPHPIDDGDILTVGCARYRFETSGLTLAEWEAARAHLLAGADGPALFLCRRGGPCGPHVQLADEQALVVGRSFPKPDQLPGGRSWEGWQQPDWDLAGLYEDERKFIAFEHAHLEQRGPSWHLRPVASRRRTFVNRLEIIDATPLSGGDEVALGSCLFLFWEPSRADTAARKAIEPPAVVDWQEGSTPLLDEASEPDQES
jgi:hypothetical protein